MSINAPADPRATAADTASPHEQPTGVRYGVVGFSVAMSILLYLDRFAIAVAMPTMREELNLNNSDVGSISSAFFWVYGLAQVPGGWLGDRWGGRIALSLFVLTWSLAMGLMGLVPDSWVLIEVPPVELWGMAIAGQSGALVAMIFLRGLLGLGQAGAYATTAGFLKRWIPLANRGLANGAVTMGGRTGAFLANALTPLLMLLAGYLFGMATGQWRAVFIFYGLLGIVWSVAFWVFFRNSPDEHPRCNAAERALIQHGLPAQFATPGEKSRRIAWGTVFASPNLWILCLLSFCINVGWIFLAQWMPIYLTDTHSQTLNADASGLVESIGLKALIGAITAALGLGGVIGCLSGGWFTDSCVRRYGLRWGRRVPGIVSTVGAGTAFLICTQMENLWILLALFAMTHFLIDLGLGSMWAVHQDVGGNYVATVLGFTNMCGNFGAAIFGKWIGKFADDGAWTNFFWISCSAYAVGLVCWLLFDATKPVIPNTEA